MAEFDLKAFRENSLHMTQAEFATFIGKTQDAVSRMEKKSDQLPLDVLMLIAEKTGQSLDQLVNYKKPEEVPFAVVDKFDEYKAATSERADYLKEHSDEVNTFKNKVAVDDYNSLCLVSEKPIEKPRVAVVGKSDAGKSRLLNYLLGANKVPTGWTPTTSAIFYIAHTDDRPAYINEDVWVFKSDEDGAPWDRDKLSDEEYTSGLRIASGGVSLLTEYGTRSGDKFDDENATSAIVFVDSPILKNCELVDLPGYGTGDREEDDSLPFEAKSKADILIYMSAAIGFLSAEEVVYVNDAIRALPPMERNGQNDIKKLGNLYVLVSQAHTIDGGNPNELEDIKSKSAERLLKSFTDDYWKEKESISGYSYDISDVRARFFTFTTDIPDLRSEFDRDFRNLIEYVPHEIKKANQQAFEAIVSNNLDDIKNENAKIEETLENMESFPPYAMNLNEAYRDYVLNSHKKSEVTSTIYEASATAGKAFTAKYKEILSEDHLVAEIKRKSVTNKKEDIAVFGTYISECIDEAFVSVMKKSDETIQNSTEAYLQEIEDFYDRKNEDSFDTLFRKHSFNAKKSFAQGVKISKGKGASNALLAGAGFAGAYAISYGLASSATMAALGSSSLLASTAGTLAASSIGGPIAVLVTAAVIATIASATILSKTWEKSVAKRCIKAFNENKCLEKYLDRITEYRDDSLSTFKSASSKMEKDLEAHVRAMCDLADHLDTESVKAEMAELKTIEDIYNDIPEVSAAIL